MSRSIKFKNNNYLDSTSIVHKQKTLNSYLAEKIDNRIVSYEMSATTGWKRIAVLHSECYGDITIVNSMSYGSVINLKVGNLAGWSRYLAKVFAIFTNGYMFTKARIVYKSASTCYLELYQNVAESRTMYISHSLNSRHVELYNSEKVGSIPDGYSVQEISLQ